MKLQCGIIPIIIAFVIGLGGGIAIGKATQPITVNHISNSKSTSISSSASMSGSILISNDKRVDVITVNITGITNVEVTSVSNGVTNTSRR